MIQYGYPIGDIVDSTKFIVPHEFDKIHLTPSRSRFLVIGTKDSIFDWMKCYGDIACKFDRRVCSVKPSPKISTRSTYKISPAVPNAVLKFELYEEKEQDDNSMLKKLLLSSGSKKMRLEIRAEYDHSSQGNINPDNLFLVVSVRSERVTKLQEALAVLKNHGSKNPKLRKLRSSEQVSRVNFDYE